MGRESHVDESNKEGRKEGGQLSSRSDGLKDGQQRGVRTHVDVQHHRLQIDAKRAAGQSEYDNAVWTSC